MKKFSKIQNSIHTERDKLLEEFSVESGLPMNTCVKLYESIGDGKFKASMKNMLKLGLKSFNTSIQQLLELLRNTAESNPEAINDLILGFIGESSNRDDSVSFFKLLLYILFMKDRKNFNQLVSDMDIDMKLAGMMKTKKVNLFESLGLPVPLGLPIDTLQNLSDANGNGLSNGLNRVPVISGFNQGVTSGIDIKFYGSLRELLAKNNKRWGHNNHLDNVYEAIQKYLEQEIKYLQNKDAMYEVDNTFEDDMIRQLLVGTLPAMYRDITFLKPMIADLQTLVFDMICLFMGYVKQHQENVMFLNRDVTNRLVTDFSMVFGKMLSSKETSHVIDKTKYENMNTNREGSATSLVEIFDKLYLKEAYSRSLVNMPLTGLVDMLYIIKSCSQDFELSLRQYLREFVTAGFEFLAKYEPIYCERIKNNKYKNSGL